METDAVLMFFSSAGVNELQIWLQIQNFVFTRVGLFSSAPTMFSEVIGILNHHKKGVLGLKKKNKWYFFQVSSTAGIIWHSSMEVNGIRVNLIIAFMFFFLCIYWVPLPADAK